MGPALVQKQSLTLKMAPAMYQSVKLLQYNNQELADFMEKKALENPLIQVEDPGYTDFAKDYPSIGGDASKSSTDVIEETLAQRDDFREHLHRDLHHLQLEEDCLRAADWLIDSLNDNGYLDEELEDLLKGFPLDRAGREKALAAVQSLDPPGVGARSLSECLLLQLKRRKPRLPLAETIIAEYSDCFLTQDWEHLSLMLGTAEQAVEEAVRVIRTLSPTPVFAASEETAHYVVPDVSIIKKDQGLIIELEDRYLPKVTVNIKDYEKYLQFADTDTKKYLHEKLSEANWLLMSVSKRKQTLLALAEMLMERQRKYFMTGKEETLQPFAMKDAARALSVHESTISRAAANKYIQTSYGLFPLKKFFIRGVKSDRGETSVYRISQLLRELISREDRENPLSDQKLSELLRKKGLHCSRRAVAKYRSACGIGSTVQRRLAKP
ncbi:RNA polymerase sigma-54 factor [Sporolactobacillus sp. THM7-4]|nr:RNA polymerase sigma-54 factor [Sporolactobacillus sp. THM7-4]